MCFVRFTLISVYMQIFVFNVHHLFIGWLESVSSTGVVFNLFRRVSLLINIFFQVPLAIEIFTRRKTNL